MKRRTSSIDIAVELAALGALGHTALKERWQELYKVPAPRKIRRDFLRYAIAYGLQERAFGSLKPHLHRQLMRLAEQQASGRAEQEAQSTITIATTPNLRPGARLVREWNGESHVVEVVEKGFLWRGRKFNSLTSLARNITGARWSGPRFFGLSGKTAEVFRS